MANSRKSIIRLAVAGLLFDTIAAAAQQPKTLNIGDPVPAIRYSRWLQGKPIPSMQDGKLYVVDFWATWCGACIGAMQHTSELSKQYEGIAQFVGVDVQEIPTAGQPYATTLPTVTAFINGPLNKMTYPAFADDSNEDMKKTWLEPSENTGLPVVFVVNHGKLIWIGHPAMLDSMMPKFVDGTFDEEAFKKQDAEMRAAVKANRVASEELERTIDSGQYQKALDIINRGLVTSPGPYFKIQKFKLLADHIDKEQAYAYLAELKNKRDEGAYEIARAVPRQANLPKKIYELSEEILRERPVNADLLYRIALLQSESGDVQGAIKTDEQAIEMSKSEIAAHKNDVVLQRDLMTYQDHLKQFEEALK